MSSFGRYTYGRPEVRWVAGTKLVVKNFTSIAANVTIYLGNGFGHDSSFVSTYPFSFIHQAIVETLVETLSSETMSGSVKMW